MDEIWINYYGMPVYFGLQEFSIVTGLGCHSLEEPSITKEIPRKRSKERKHKEKIDGLFDIARRGYKALDLLADLMDKTIPNQYRELGHLKPFLPSETRLTTYCKLCYRWVVHPWIVPTEQESVVTLGHVDTIADPILELVKKELAGAISIRRAVRQGQPNVEALHDQPTYPLRSGWSSQPNHRSVDEKQNSKAFGYQDPSKKLSKIAK
ncbi:hypothetical protein FXO37_26779 [Capsicum annuum]|nr:hypothetical protein FXO37_26779 [Capsicum annuum]